MKNIKELWKVTIDGHAYTCTVEWKSKRNIRYSVSRDGESLYVSVPHGTKKETIKEGITKYFPKLLKRFEYEPPFGEGYVYIFGRKVEDPQFTELSEKERTSVLNRILLRYVTERTEQVKGIMGVTTPYKVKVRNMTSRYGVNNWTGKSITYSTILIHYSKEIIDSVIYHEVTHDHVRDHSSRFYQELLSFLPDYHVKHDKLRKHKYE